MSDSRAQNSSRAQNWQPDIYAGGLISVSGFSPVKPKIHITRSQTSRSANPKNEEIVVSSGSFSEKPPRRKKGGTGRGSVYSLFVLWLLVLAAIAYSVVNNSDNSFSTLPLTLSAAGLGVLSLILTGFAQKPRAKIVHSFGISMASLCFAVLLWIYLQTTERSISPEVLIMSLSGASLIIARIWQSPYLLNVSLLLVLGWSIYAFMAYEPSQLAWVFPALWSVQMFFALEFRITRTVLLSVFTGLVWIGVNLPALNL